MKENDEIDNFDLFVKYYNQDLIKLEEKDYEICRRFSSYNATKYDGINLNYAKLYKMFLKSIDSLGNDTKEYYRNTNVTIKRVISESGYAEIVGNTKQQTIYLNKAHLKDIDFIAYSHEMGHIPSLKSGDHFDFLEYGEILPIFFEYLAALYLDKDNTDTLFLMNRLDAGEIASFLFIESNAMIKGNGSIGDKMLYNEMREHYKYIISLEYALNLIELYHTDRIEFNKYLDNIIIGKNNFKELEKNLNLDIKSYKKLKKYI